MRTLRPVIAVDPKVFGRRTPFVTAHSDSARSSLPNDARLFMTTFAAGFLFVSVLLA